MNEKVLARLSLAAGGTCVAISALATTAGADSLPGVENASPEWDSQERFFGAIFGGYGLLWIRAGRPPADLATLDVVSGAMLAGGAARLLSMRTRGRPHPFLVGLTAVEFVVPAVFLGLTRSVRRGRRAVHETS